MTHHIHFGVYRDEHGDILGDPVALDGHNDPSTEREIHLPQVMRDAGIDGYISGSWGCWGPADQATDGDESLHVVYYSPHVDAKHLADLHAFTQFSLPDTSVHVLDYAIVTTDDWSEITHVAIFGGTPWCSVFAENAVVDSTNYHPHPDKDPA